MIACGARTLNPPRELPCERTAAAAAAARTPALRQRRPCQEPRPHHADCREEEEAGEEGGEEAQGEEGEEGEEEEEEAQEEEGQEGALRRRQAEEGPAQVQVQHCGREAGCGGAEEEGRRPLQAGDGLGGPLGD